MRPETAPRGGFAETRTVTILPCCARRRLTGANEGLLRGRCSCVGVLGAGGPNSGAYRRARIGKAFGGTMVRQMSDDRMGQVTYVRHPVWDDSARCIYCTYEGVLCVGAVCMLCR